MPLLALSVQICGNNCQMLKISVYNNLSTHLFFPFFSLPVKVKEFHSKFTIWNEFRDGISKMGKREYSMIEMQERVIEGESLC